MKAIVPRPDGLARLELERRVGAEAPLAGSNRNCAMKLGPGMFFGGSRTLSFWRAMCGTKAKRFDGSVRIACAPGAVFCRSTAGPRTAPSVPSACTAASPPPGSRRTGGTCPRGPWPGRSAGARWRRTPARSARRWPSRCDSSRSPGSRDTRQTARAGPGSLRRPRARRRPASRPLEGTRMPAPLSIVNAQVLSPSWRPHVQHVRHVSPPVWRRSQCLWTYLVSRLPPASAR